MKVKSEVEQMWPLEGSLQVKQPEANEERDNGNTL